jgi:glycosyltransferase involved in cell wall biosynthesis
MKITGKTVEPFVLYLTYDGIGDHIGQSQILPYILENAAKGIKFHILSFEKRENAEKVAKAEAALSAAGVKWHRLTFTRGNFLVKIYDFIRFNLTTYKINRKNRYHIIHSRSYIASAVSLTQQTLFGTKIIFDKRDFWIDASVEIGKLRLSNPVHRVAHHFFRRFERKLFRRATHIVSLTEKAKQVVLNRYPERSAKDITVIPCCVDLNLFNPGNVDPAQLASLKHSLNLEQGTVLGYVGSIGPTYRVEELMDCFKVMSEEIPGLKLLFIINNGKEDVYELAEKKQISTSSIVVTSCSRNEMPLYISLFDFGFFFVMPTFAKQASSPTKLSEMLAMGKYVITNYGIGDVEEIFQKLKCGFIIRSFEESSYRDASAWVSNMHNATGNFDLTEYSLPYGASKYYGVYQNLIAD